MVKERILCLLNEEFDFGEDISLDVSWHKLGWDSLDVVELLLLVQDDFDIEINDLQASQIKCIGDLIRHVEKIMV